MKVKLIRSYRSQNGNVTFVYGVSGNATQLAAYKEAQGTYYREDETTGQPLWFTVRCIGKAGSLIITSKGKIVPDMSEFDQAASLVEQYGGNFGQTLAQGLMANLVGGNTPSVEAPSAQIEEEAPASEDLENL